MTDLWLVFFVGLTQSPTIRFVTSLEIIQKCHNRNFPNCAFFSSCYRKLLNKIAWQWKETKNYENERKWDVIMKDEKLLKIKVFTFLENWLTLIMRRTQFFRFLSSPPRTHFSSASTWKNLPYHNFLCYQERLIVFSTDFRQHLRTLCFGFRAFFFQNTIQSSLKVLTDFFCVLMWWKT